MEKKLLHDWMMVYGYDPENINDTDDYDNTPLMRAAREGNLGALRELLDLGADMSRINTDGNTALWFACYADCPNAMKMLLDAGIEVDTQNDNKVTPLMYAASSGKEAAVEVLIEHGADATLKNLDDFSALDLAVTPKILRILRNAATAR